MINNLLRTFEHKHKFQCYTANALNILYDPDLYPEIIEYNKCVRGLISELDLMEQWRDTKLPRPGIAITTTAGSIIHCSEMMKELPVKVRENLHECIFGDVSIIGTQHLMYDNGIWRQVGSQLVGLTIPLEWLHWGNGIIPGICRMIESFEAFQPDVYNLLAEILKRCAKSTGIPDVAFYDYLIKHLTNGKQHYYGCWFVDLMNNQIKFSK